MRCIEYSISRDERNSPSRRLELAVTHLIPIGSDRKWALDTKEGGPHPGRRVDVRAQRSRRAQQSRSRALDLLVSGKRGI